jgi:hypothetical protein
MGPLWFYEGFEVYGADQYVGAAPKLANAEIWKIAGAQERVSSRIRAIRQTTNLSASFAESVGT